MSNFYEVLRVRTNATQSQIKKSFLELVSKYHPDVYKGDKAYAEKYTAILTEAYSILKDPDKRLDYDIKNNINTRPNFFQRINEDRVIKREKKKEKSLAGRNYEQEMSMKYFKNSERKKTKSSLLKKIFTSKLFYCLLFVLGIEALVILFIYYR